MKTIITKDLSSTLSPTADQLLKVAADGEGFVWVPDLSHSHSNKAILDAITSAPVETITAWANVSVNRVGNNVTISSSGGGGWTPVNTCWFNVLAYSLGIGDGVNTTFALTPAPAGWSVFFVGWQMVAPTDYTITPTDVVLDEAPALWEVVSAIYNVATTGTPLVFGSYNVWVGDGSQTVFTLPVTPFDNESVVPFVDGISGVLTTDYSIVGNQITFVEAPLLDEVITAMIVESHKVSYYTVTATATGTGQSFPLPTTAVKVLHIGIDHLSSYNHSSGWSSILINDDVMVGDVITFAYLNNATCTITGGAVENQQLLLSGNTLSITTEDGATVLNSVTLPTGGGGGWELFRVSIAPLTPYPLTHGLDIEFPQVTCYLDIPGQHVVFFPDIVYQDSNNIIISHSITSLPTVPFAIRVSN